MKSTSTRERGEGRAGTLIAVAIIGFAIYMGIKYIPVMINTYTFRDSLEEEARYAAIRKGNEEVFIRVMDKAKDLDIPLDRSNLNVSRSRSVITISAKYTVPVETIFFTHQWEFEEEATAPLF